MTRRSGDRFSGALKSSAITFTAAGIAAGVIIWNAEDIVPPGLPHGVLVPAATARSVILGSLLTTFLTNSDTEKSKALIEAAIRRISTKGTDTTLPSAIPNNLYVYYVSHDGGRRYWQFKIIEKINGVDLGWWLGHEYIKSPEEEPRQYLTEIYCKRRRIMIATTNAHSDEPTGLMSLSTDFPKGHRYGIHYHSDWDSVPRLDPAMAFDKPQDFNSKPKLGWPKASVRIEDTERVGILDQHYQAKLPYLFKIDKDFD